jgi:hypothetical protein
MVRFLRFFFFAVILTAVGVVGAYAGSDGGKGRATFGPPVVKAYKGKRIAPGNIMRRWHGQFLYRQRTETLRQGIRGKKYSLRGCVECHAVPDPKAKDKKVRSVLPFCASCHKYTATTIDCFTCHTPFAQKKPLKAGLLPFNHPGKPGAGKVIANSLRKYLTISQARQ